MERRLTHATLLSRERADMNAHRTTILSIMILVLVFALVTLQFPRPPMAAGAAVTAQADLTAKGFVTAKTATTLTVREGGKRVVVAVTSNTRVLGERDSFDSIATNDIIRVEGRMVGNRLVAARVEVLLTAAGIRDRPQPKELEIDLFTIDMSSR
jgi:hypothetical protein